MSTTARKRNKALITVVVLFGVIAAIVASSYEWFMDVRAIARLASCRPWLIYRASQMYAFDNGGLFPPLSPIPGRLTYDTNRLATYAFSVSDHICESDAEGPREQTLSVAPLDRVDDWSYVYLGHVIENEEQGLAFANAYPEHIDSVDPFVSDMRVALGAGNGGANVLCRLRLPDSFEGKFSYLREKAGEIPVVIEWPGNHGERGGKVVFLDGHEEVIPFPGKFPMTERFISALRDLDSAFPARTP